MTEHLTKAREQDMKRRADRARKQRGQRSHNQD